MRKILFFVFFFIIIGCSKPKTVFICGDHVCVNKKEAEQYFEENLTLEVKIINKKEKKILDLVQLNLQSDSKGIKKIAIINKKETDKQIKTLSKDEIKKVKSKIKKLKKAEDLKIKENKDKQSKLKVKLPKNSIKKNKIKKKKIINNANNNVVDICTILKKCSIDEISKYLIKQGKNKKFPDINIKE